jgi:hypothetical protein
LPPPIKSPGAVNTAVASVPATTPTLVPRSQIDRAPAPVVPGVSTGTSVTSTNSVPLLDITTAAVNVIPTPTTGNVIIPSVTRPAGNVGSIQFNNNGAFGGAGALFHNSVTGTLNIRANVYNNGFGGLTSTAPILFYDRNGNQAGMVNWVQPVSGSSVSGTGVHISPWPNYNGSSTSVRNDAGISVYRGPPGLFYRTVTNINEAQSGPGPHGLNLYDGSIYVNSYEPSARTAGFSQVILNTVYDVGRAVGQLSSFAYTSPDQGRMWTLGWKQVSAVSPNRAAESTPGNINISWNSNNRVGINNPSLTESFNVLGNVRIQATGNITNTGIKFADGTFQYTAATGSLIAIQEEGTNVVASANTINFVGSGITASNVGGVATITVSSGIAVQEEGSNVVSTANTVNFVGAGVTASNVSGVATITIPGGGSGITVQEESSNVVASASTINFVGSGVTASNVSGVATITVSSGLSGVAVQEEGSNVVATANTINFVGSGVTASNVAGVATITVNGLAVQEEGSNVVASASTINFVGSGVTASNVGGVATVTVTGSSGDTVYNLGDISGTTVVNVANGTIQTCTLTANVFFNLASVTSGKSVTLLMTQGTGGNKLATYDGTVRFAAGYKTLSTAAGAVDMLNIVNIGGTYYATLTVGYTT